MKSLRFLDRRAGYSLASLGLLLGVVAPAAIPAFASAGMLTTRSITMSSSAASAASTSYTLTYTPTTSTGATGGIFVDFCSDTPLITTTCTAPTGFDASSATASAGTITPATNSLKLVTATTAATPFTVTFSGITNPSTVGTFYARVMSYDGTTNPISNHTSTTSQGAYSDSGSIALSTTEQVGVTAYVLESMTFCVSKAEPTKGCVGTTAPNVTLGETTGSVTALDAGHLSTQDIYAQLSTNASQGAIVNMKSDATNCGGLFRNGNTANCEIAPQNVGANDISAGQALFGVKLGTAAYASDASASSDHTGTLQAANGSSYGTSKFFMDYASGNSTGVTSTYGSPFIDTNSTVVSNMNIPITLGASVSNQTPAGSYGATLSMIATGKF